MEAIEYVAAAYGVALATLVVWLWIIASKVRRLGEAAMGDDQDTRNA